MIGKITIAGLLAIFTDHGFFEMFNVQSNDQWSLK
jgi:hypothetical protein